jgi:PD-(D/E)XK nuclease superfamily
MASAVDQWGRYLITPPEGGKAVPHTRATTWAKTLDDQHGLSLWRQRTTALGLAQRSDLLALVAAAKDDDSNALDEVCESALQAAQGSAGANLGSALHSFTERIDRGEMVEVPEPWRGDIDAYTEALHQAGIKVEAIEQVCVCRELTVAGTFDRIVSFDGRLFIADLKTAKDLRYSWTSIAMQLAIYAHASTLYNVESGEHTPMPAVDQLQAIVIHLPVGKAKCDLYFVDIAEGWRGANLAKWARTWRKVNGLHAPLTDSTSERRTCLVAQVRRLVDEYPDAARDLAGLWPAGVPTLKENGQTPEDLEEIAQAVQKVEAVHRVPFGDPDPLRAQNRQTKEKP